MNDTRPIKPALSSVGGTKVTDNPSARSAADWGIIEVEWLMGVKPVTHIARQQGISPGSVYKMAQRRGWGRRDLAGIAKVATDGALIRRAVAALGDKHEVAQALEAIGDAARLDAGGELVERYAELVAGVVEEHRTLSKSGRELAAKLAVLAHDCFERIQEQFNDPLQHQRTLLAHTQILRRLAQATATWVKIEREAYGMGTEEGDSGDTKGYEDYLRDAKDQGRIK